MQMDLSLRAVASQEDYSVPVELQRLMRVEIYMSLHTKDRPYLSGPISRAYERMRQPKATERERKTMTKRLSSL